MNVQQGQNQEEPSENNSTDIPSQEPSMPDIPEVSALRQKLREKQAETEQLLGNWQRAEADMSNLRKRTEHDQQETTLYANAILVANILPILDDLERALQSVEKSMEGFTWIDGIRMIYYRALHILESQGLDTINSIGKQFDPREHQAISYGDGEDGQVIDELQKGYKLHERVIRPAMVKVGQGAKNEEKS